LGIGTDDATYRMGAEMAFETVGSSADRARESGTRKISLSPVRAAWDPWDQ